MTNEVVSTLPEVGHTTTLSVTHNAPTPILSDIFSSLEKSNLFNRVPYTYKTDSGIDTDSSSEEVNYKSETDTDSSLKEADYDNSDVKFNKKQELILLYDQDERKRFLDRYNSNSSDKLELREKIKHTRKAQKIEDPTKNIPYSVSIVPTNDPKEALFLIYVPGIINAGISGKVRRVQAIKLVKDTAGQWIEPKNPMTIELARKVLINKTPDQIENYIKAVLKKNKIIPLEHALQEINSENDKKPPEPVLQQKIYETERTRIENDVKKKEEEHAKKEVDLIRRLGNEPAGYYFSHNKHNILMPLYKGSDLVDYIKGKPDIYSSLAIINDIIYELADIHGKGFLHRDLKLDNILEYRFQGDQHAAVVDFGSACKVEDAKKLGIAGTSDYMPEEIFSLNHSQTIISDWWGIGAIIKSLFDFIMRDEIGYMVLETIKISQHGKEKYIYRPKYLNSNDSADGEINDYGRLREIHKFADSLMDYMNFYNISKDVSVDTILDSIVDQWERIYPPLFNYYKGVASQDNPAPNPIPKENPRCATI